MVLSRRQRRQLQLPICPAALCEAERASEIAHLGINVDNRVWRLAKAYWEDCQNVDGSWGYYQGLRRHRQHDLRRHHLAHHRQRHGPSGRRSGPTAITSSAAGGATWKIAASRTPFNWLGRNFHVDRKPRQRQNFWLYYLYGIERAGRLTARRFIGGHDWYREGADYLIQHQAGVGDGFWRGKGHAETEPIIGTSLSLLFLSKGRRPVLLAKLRHGSGEDWNQHRNDAANLTIYVETKWKRDLTWQVIDLGAASVDDLMQAPVLFLCGSRSPLPADPEQRQELAQKLRDYLDRGGFLFAEGYCGSEGFDRGFCELMTLVFPNEPEYRLKLLDPRTRSGTPKRRSIRIRCGRCWGSNLAAARAWSMPRPTRSRGLRFRVFGNCRGAAGSRSFRPRCRRRSTPPARSASTSWPMPPIAK